MYLVYIIKLLLLHIYHKLILLQFQIMYLIDFVQFLKIKLKSMYKFLKYLFK